MMCLLLVVEGEWSSSPEDATTSIPQLYFCESKLALWSNVADRAIEACRTTRAVISRYFDTHRRDVVSQLVGRISNQSRLLNFNVICPCQWGLSSGYLCTAVLYSVCPSVCMCIWPTVCVCLSDCLHKSLKFTDRKLMWLGRNVMLGSWAPAGFFCRSEQIRGSGDESPQRGPGWSPDWSLGSKPPDADEKLWK